MSAQELKKPLGLPLRRGGKLFPTPWVRRAWAFGNGGVKSKMDLVLEDILNDLSPYWDFVLLSFEHTKRFFSWYSNCFLCITRLLVENYLEVQ